MNYHYNQLAGALGTLHRSGIVLPYAELDERLKTIAATHGPYGCDTQEVKKMHKTYRALALRYGLINIGELFDANDATPIV